MNVKISKPVWDDKTSEYFDDFLKPYTDVIRLEVETGLSELFKVSGDAEGLFCTRIELNVDGSKELCLIAAKGKGVHVVMPYLKDMCKKQGIKRIRTSRPVDLPHKKAYGRFISQADFKEYETVYIYEVEL